MNLLSLPNEILIIIINHLKLDDVIKLSKMNDKLFEITKYHTRFEIGSNYLESLVFLKHLKKIEYFADMDTSYHSYYIKYAKKLNLNHLKSIKLNYCSCLSTDNLREFILNNNNLQELVLDDQNSLESHQLSLILNKCKNLVNLSLLNTKVNSYNLSKLNPNMQKLLLYNCVNIDSTSIGLFNFPELKELALNNCSIYSDILLAKIFKKLPKLEKINLSSTYVSYFTIREIIKNCPNINCLNLSTNYGNISNFHSILITDKFTNLVYLNLSFSSITDCAVSAMVKKLKVIKYLYLSYTYIKEISAFRLLTSFPTLEYFSVDGTSIFSNYLLKNIYYYGDNFKYIQFETKNLNYSLFNKILSKYPKLYLNWNLPTVQFN